MNPPPRVVKIGDLGEKNMQISNKTVNLLSKQALAMNLCISSVVLNVQSSIVDVDT